MVLDTGKHITMTKYQAMRTPSPREPKFGTADKKLDRLGQDRNGGPHVRQRQGQEGAAPVRGETSPERC